MLKLRAIKQLVESNGAQLIRADPTGPHWKVYIRLPNQHEHMMVLSKSTSCYRARKNQISYIKRIVRENEK